jgi:hypothetical protein
MGRKRAAIDAALFATRLSGHRVLLVVRGLVCSNGLLDILDGQKQLLGIEFLRTPAKLRPLQLAGNLQKSGQIQWPWRLMCRPLGWCHTRITAEPNFWSIEQTCGVHRLRRSRTQSTDRR